MLTQDQIRVYGGTSNHDLDATILTLVKRRLNYPDLKFTRVIHNTWADGEPGFRLNEFESIAGKTVVIFTSVIDDKTELQIRDMVMACHLQYGAKRVIVVMSFLRYRRQDHDEYTHEINRLRMFIKNLKDGGVDHLILCEPHNVAKTMSYCQEFGLAVSIADPTELFVEEINPLLLSCGMSNVVVFSPDFGSVGRGLTIAERLKVPLVALPKRRINGRLELVTDVSAFRAMIEAHFSLKVPLSCNIDDVQGNHVVFREDEVASGATSAKQAWRLHDVGTRGIYLLATHPVCNDGWRDNLFPFGETAPFTSIYLGNTRRRGIGKTPYEGSTDGEVTVVDMAPVLADRLVQLLEDLND